MRWSEGFIAVDWGTTNRRAYRLDSAGNCADSFEDGQGLLSVAPGEFPAEAAQIRARLGNLPLMLAGMVGSVRGWREAPYVACPAGLADLAQRLCWVEQDSIAIVPGLSVMDGGRADVMRGEEVQLVGAVASELIPADCFVGHPGTHNKWVAVAGGKVAGFRTVMTGEMFGALRERGLLAEMLATDVTLGAAFREGVERGLDRPLLTAELFSVRAALLLSSMNKADSSSYVSGLLIGADVGLGLEMAGSAEVTLMGDPDLTRLYAAALDAAGRECREVDGETAFLAGAAALARTVQ